MIIILVEGMSSSSDVQLTAVFASLAVQINRYFSLIVFIFAVIGSCLNTLVFGHRALRSSPCSRFFLASSAAAIPSLLSGLIGRIVAGWAADPASRSIWLCKFRTLVNETSQCAAIWLIALASIDRWLVSSPNVTHRQMSSVRNATRSIVLTLLLSGLSHIPHTICYEPFQLPPIPLHCYGATSACRLFDDLFYASIVVLLPCSLMLVFGCMTIKNIHQSRRATRPNNIQMSIGNQQTKNLPNAQLKTKMKNERNLTKMLLIQVFILILFTLPQACNSLYATITYGRDKSVLQKAFDQFFYNLTLLLSYMAVGLPFYMYTLTGSVFRSTLMQLFQGTLRIFERFH